MVNNICKNFMQDHRADVYISTWTRKIVGNGPSFIVVLSSYNYFLTIQLREQMGLSSVTEL